MNEKASAMVIELAKDLMQFCNDVHTDPPWDQAFYRFMYNKNHRSACGSYIDDSSTISFLGDVGNKTHSRFGPFSDKLFANSEKLFELLEEERGLFLLTVNADGGYGIEFDFENLKRWGISKIDGASGLPLDD